MSGPAVRFVEISEFRSSTNGEALLGVLDEVAGLAVVSSLFGSRRHGESIVVDIGGLPASTFRDCGAEEN